MVTLGVATGLRLAFSTLPSLILVLCSREIVEEGTCLTPALYLREDVKLLALTLVLYTVEIVGELP